MTAFEASAPGKIILFGEHAVVYGQPAIAVPLPAVRATAVVKPGTMTGSLVIVAANLARTLVIRHEPDRNEHALAVAVRKFLALTGQSIPSLQVTLHSTIPVASGLGSGAAVTTAVLRALSLATQHPLTSETLNELVYEVERLHHGTPSGIDNTVVVFEKPVYFVRGKPIETFSVGQPVHLVVADTGVSSATHLAVGDVRKLHTAEPERIGAVTDAIGEIVREARAAFADGDASGLGELARRNQVHLQSLTVSSPELEHLIAVAEEHGAFGAKLSGGGRGGNMIAFVPPDLVSGVCGALQANGAARVIHTTIS